LALGRNFNQTLPIASRICIVSFELLRAFLITSCLGVSNDSHCSFPEGMNFKQANYVFDAGITLFSLITWQRLIRGGLQPFPRVIRKEKNADQWD